MFRTLFSRFRPVRQPLVARLPDGQRAYAIGDIHGRFDLLVNLLGQIERDNAARGSADTQVIFLGDLIDRGPHSAEVVEYLRVMPPAFATCHFILGNHEEAMLVSLGPDSDPHRTNWLRFGGLETLRSYGVPDHMLEEADGPRLAEDARFHVPDQHLRFLDSFDDQLRLGDYLFVHAGIRPGVALERQVPDDLRWIREEFLNDPRNHGVIVVHGHTIRPEPEFRSNRIGIDTGAYRSGVLTALGLEGGECWTLSTQPPS
jgi:serine/threonine protein phosphatase 1